MNEIIKKRGILEKCASSCVRHEISCYYRNNTKKLCSSEFCQNRHERLVEYKDRQSNGMKLVAVF